MAITPHPSVGNGVYSPEEQQAAKIVASCIEPNYPGGVLSRNYDLGYYNSAVDAVLDSYADIDIAVMAAARKGEAYDPTIRAAETWAGLREMSGPATPYARIAPLVDVLVAKVQEAPEIPADVRRMPIYDKAGYVYCPNHRTKRLIRTKSGDAWRCPEHMCFYWPGEGYTAPAAQSAPAQAEQTQAERPRLWLSEEEIEHSLFPPEMLVKDVIVAGETTVVFGLGDSGKTFIVIDIAMRIAQHYPVLYVAGEDGSGIKIRKAAWQAHYHKPTNGRFYLVNGPVNLMDDRAVDDFLTQVHPLDLKLIVFDTLSQCSAGADDSSNKEMSIFTANANRIAHETGASVIVIHHTTKGGESYRGASCIKDNTYGFLRVEKDDDGITFECVRIKNTEPFKPRKYRLITEIATNILHRDGTIATSCVIAPAIRSLPSDKLTISEIKILETAGYVCKAQGHVAASELQRATGLEGRKFWGPLGKLKDKGMLQKGDKHTSPYYLTEQGRTFLNSAYKDDRSHYSAEDAEPELFEVNTCVGIEVTSKKVEVTTELLPGSNDGSNRKEATDSNSTDRIAEQQSVSIAMEVTTEVTRSNVTSFHSHPLIRGGVEVTEGRKEENQTDAEAIPKYMMLDWGFAKRVYDLGDLVALQRHCILTRSNYDDVLAELQGDGQGDG